MQRAGIAALLPHAGAMVLLDQLEAWDAENITCRASSHLEASNPLRRAGRLGAEAGIEYAMQAAALHGALTAGGQPQPVGFLASLREVALQAEWLDDPAHGRLRIAAQLQHREASGLLYAFTLATADHRPLLQGRAAIALSRPA